MQEHEIANARDLDAVLAGNALSRRRKLWKAANGQSVRWPDALIGLLGGLQVCFGLYGALVDDERSYVIMLVLGLFLLFYSLWRLQQVQIDALRELLRLTTRNES